MSPELQAALLRLLDRSTNHIDRIVEALRAHRNREPSGDALSISTAISLTGGEIANALRTVAESIREHTALLKAIADEQHERERNA